MFEILDFDAANLMEDDSEFEHSRVETKRLVVFELGSELYGIPIGDVVEVRESLPTTPLPFGRAPDYVLGLVSLRGAILPVVDLALILGYGAEAAQESGPLIIVKGTGWQIAWQVKDIMGLVRIPINTFQAPPPNGAEAGYYEAVTRWEGRLLMQLNAQEIIRKTRVAAGPSAQP